METEPINMNTHQDFVHKYCRTCGTHLSTQEPQGQGLLIFGPEGRALQLSEKIRKTCSVLVLEEDKLPKRICFTCCTQLEGYWEFKENVQDTQEKLRTIVRTLDSSAHSSTGTGASTTNIRSLFINSTSPTSSSALERPSRNINNLIPPLLPTQGTSNPRGNPEETQFLECKDCNLKFKDQIALETHTESEHPQNPVELVPENPPSVDGHNDNNPPSVESQNNNGPDISTSSAASGQNSTGESEPGTSSTYACESCDRVFMSTSGYYTHVLSVHKGRRFNCPHCSVKYAQKASLTIHLRTHHPSSPQITPSSLILQCPSCPSSFYDRKSLTAHSVTHLKDRNYQCHICSKYYKTSRCLSKHVSCHLSTDKFKCSICQKGFNRKVRLDEHYNTHNGANGLGCPFCFKVFNSYANYSKHVKRKHGEMIGEGDRLPQPKRGGNSVSSSIPTATDTQNQAGVSNPVVSGGSVNSIVTTAASSDLGGQSGLTLSTYTVGQSQNSTTVATLSWTDNQNHSQTTNQSKSANFNQLNSSAMELVDCAIQSTIISQDNSHGLHLKSTSNFHSHSEAHSSTTNLQQQPLFKYSLDSSSTHPTSTTSTNFQDMPMELTKVFQESASSSRPLELCVRNDGNGGDGGFSQLVDLTSKEQQSNLVIDCHQPHHHYGTAPPNSNNQQYQHQQQQPIDLISRSDICNLNSSVNSVDLSLRSTFSDQSTSSFIRELLDLSSRSDYLHEPTHTSPTKNQNLHINATHPQTHNHHQLTELNLSCPSTNRSNSQPQNLYNAPNPTYYNRLPPAPSQVHPPPHNIPHYNSPTNQNQASSANSLLNSVYSDALFS